MTAEAPFRNSEGTRTPAGDGWFVLHASEAPWFRHERFGKICRFEGEARFPEIGMNLRVLEPGQPASLYHRDSGQEDFFVLSGECLVVIEGEERRLRAGHFVHCPPGTTHVFVGGEGGCAILMVGYRSPSKRLLYPVSAAAAKHGASVTEETDDPQKAYGGAPRFTDPTPPVWPL